MLAALVALFITACGGSEDESAADGDAELEPEQDAEPAVDCAARRAAPQPGAPADCTAWCNKVEECGGATDGTEECQRDCYAKTYEVYAEVLDHMNKCIASTTCQMFEAAREDGDTSANLEVYCRRSALADRPTSLDREDACDLVYETLLTCAPDSAGTNRTACVTIHALMWTDETFRHYARCAKHACEGTAWTDCLEEGICQLITEAP